MSTTAIQDSPTNREIDDLRQRLRSLPEYAQSLLKIQVPVVVTLATAQRPVQEVMDLAPGSIIQFEKGFDETLSLEIGNQTIAEGEAVKVGEKFGLRITSMTLPGEMFYSLKSFTTEASPDRPDSSRSDD